MHHVDVRAGIRKVSPGIRRPCDLFNVAPRTAHLPGCLLPLTLSLPTRHICIYDGIRAKVYHKKSVSSIPGGVRFPLAGLYGS